MPIFLGRNVAKSDKANSYPQETGPDTWFLVKDSWKTAYQGPVKGYFFYREDYLKLKVLMIMTHKDAVADLLAKFPPAS